MHLEVTMAKVKKALPHVPAERTLKIVAGRWKVFILYFLRKKPHRLSELRKLSPEASPKMLVQQLRELEEHGVVRREVFAEVPARVEYSLTRMGTTLGPLLDELCAWGKRHASGLAD
jgi:DNA-binding HxlR family transcriptional regulator